MCNTSSLHPPRPFGGVVDPFSFSTFHLLRTCNRLILPSQEIQNYCNIVKDSNPLLTAATPINLNGSNSSDCVYNPSETSSKSPILDVMESLPMSEEDLQITDSDSSHQLQEKAVTQGSLLTVGSLESEPAHIHGTSRTSPSRTPSTPIMTTSLGPLSIGLPSTLSVLPLDHGTSPSHNNNTHHYTHHNSNNNNKSPLPGFGYIAPMAQHQHLPVNMGADFPLMELNRVSMGGGGMFPAFMHRRPRGEKRPIPDEQKDEKYYERRKRNNEAAKKSRDARKIREDRIAFRAALLEQENSILRAQVMALRDELQAMRQLMGGAPLARGPGTQL